MTTPAPIARMTSDLVREMRKVQALKPCPFCGERPSLTLRPDNAEASTYFAAVACFCGGYSACAHKMATATNADEAEAKARAAWNRRAADTSLAALSEPQDERAAFEAWMSSNYPHAWPRDKAEHAWQHSHVAALAWQARASLAPAPQPSSQNQCDGCLRGLPMVNGLHNGGPGDLIGCTAHLYAPQPASALAAVREPLSDEQILIAFDDALELECDVTDAEVIDFARVIERAHGIGITAQAQQEGGR